MTDLWRNKETGYITFEVDPDVDNMDYWEPVFAPKREWVEITRGEISEIWGNSQQTIDEEKDAIAFGFAVEAKLKEKNT